MEYLSIRQTAEEWELSKRRVQVLCAEERIPGAMKLDSSWVIPADAVKPYDARIKSGRTENAFDSYLYQLVESKQKFLGILLPEYQWMRLR